MGNSIGAAKGGHYVAAHDLEDEIVCVGLQDQYIRALWMIVFDGEGNKERDISLYGYGEVDAEDIFKIKHATPEQCARAFEQIYETHHPQTTDR